MADVSPAVKAKSAAWQRQHAALDAPAYRLTLKSRRDELQSFNHGKGRLECGSERFYAAPEVEHLLPYLSRANAKGYDVYVTPIDPDHHYLVVDDMHGDVLQRLKAVGYAPALVQESSADNEQAIIKTPRRNGEPGEQQVANALVVELNREYGDPKFSGVIHPFRLAGFSNKKEGRGNAFTRLIETPGGLCQRAAARLAEIRVAATAEAVAVQEQRRQSGRDRESPPPPPARSTGSRDDELPTSAAGRYRHLVRLVRGLVRDQGWNEDLSRVDWRVVRSMLDEGWEPSEVRAGLLAASPDLHDRHSNPDDYAVRTVERARAFFLRAPAPAAAGCVVEEGAGEEGMERDFDFLLATSRKNHPEPGR